MFCKGDLLKLCNIHRKIPVFEPFFNKLVAEFQVVGSVNFPKFVRTHFTQKTTETWRIQNDLQKKTASLCF